MIWQWDFALKVRSYEKIYIDVDTCGRIVSAHDGLRDKKSAAKVQKCIC